MTTLEDSERTARRVFGGAHPIVWTLRGILRSRASDAPRDARRSRRDDAVRSDPSPRCRQATTCVKKTGYSGGGNHARLSRMDAIDARVPYSPA